MTTATHSAPARAQLEQQLLSIALDLAHNGYYIHPLAARDKIPLAEHGSNDATRDEATIRAWWRRWPNANVGISLDKTGLVDIAPDCPEWAARFKANGMPHTILYTSGGGPGCWHALYRLPRGGPVARINVSKQYDLMSRGNAVAPGSIHPSGRTYTTVTPIQAVEDLPLAPDWVLVLLAEKQTRSASAPADSAEWERLPKGAALAQSRRFLALCKANEQLRMVCAGEAVVLKTKTGGKDGSTSIQRSVFVNQLLRAKYPHAEIRALALHFSGVLESNPRHFERDIDRLLRPTAEGGYTPADYAPQPTGAIVAAPAAPRGGRHYEITASDMLDRYHEHAGCGPVGIILDWTIDDAAQRLGVSTGTIKRREAELTEAGRIRRDYGRVILEPAEIRSQPIVMRQTAPIAAAFAAEPVQSTDETPIGSQSGIVQPNAENPTEIPVCVEHAHVEETHFPANPQAQPPALATIAEARPGALAPGECVLSAPAGAPDSLAGWRIVRPARGPWCWAATEGAMTATHPRDTSDQVLIAAAWSKAAALAEVRAVEPVAIEKPQIAESVAPSSAPQEAAAGPGGWRKVVLGFDDSAQPELASFDGSGVPVPVAEPAPVPILVELDPLVQAPPIASEPTYLEFIWRYRAAQPGSIRKKTGAPWSNAQRARFKVEYQALLVDVSPEEAALRWAALQQPQARPSAPARAGVGDARPSQARRAAGPPLRAPGQQALLFGGAD